VSDFVPGFEASAVGGVGVPRSCITVSIDREKYNKERGWNSGLSQTDERWESNLTVVDPLSGEIKKNLHLR
jgi:hypothetical protein